MSKPRDPASYQEVLKEVNEQVDRMTRLVNGLLILARSDAGTVTLQQAPVDVSELIDSVVEQVRPLAQQKGLYLKTEADGASSVYGDEGLLFQLLLNLADNAVKYTSTGSVTLGWRSEAPAGIFVADTGPGIGPAHREKIFERFYRVGAARGGGTGLGLAIARWIAEAHGGSILLESGEDGSTFIVMLPTAN